MGKLYLMLFCGLVLDRQPAPPKARR